MTLSEEMIDPREAIIDELIEIAKENTKLVVLDADVSRTSRTRRFRNVYPKKFYDFGIAEQNLLGVAAGMATTGVIPVATTFAVFIVMRACEQLRTSICYPNLNVKVIGGYAGLSNGKDGATHQSVEDIAITRSFPNLTVIAPSDAVLARKAMRAAVEHEGPVYIRLEYEQAPVIYDENFDFQIGRGHKVKEGADVTVVSCGIALNRVLGAVSDVAKDGITVEVLDMLTLKPFDEELLCKSVKKTGAIVTVEDHNIIGGLASTVCQCLFESGIQAKYRGLGIKDVFTESGKTKELRDKYGVGQKEITKAIRALTAVKSVDLEL